MIKYERMKVSNKIIRDLDINITSYFQAVRRGLATKETNHPSTPAKSLDEEWEDLEVQQSEYLGLPHRSLQPWKPK
jgi:hypothetical protein